MGSVVVDVIRAQELSRSCSCVFVDVHFGGQTNRTSRKEDTNSPVWNERFSFDVPDVQTVADFSLEAFVCNGEKTGSSSKSSVLGVVRIAGTSFVQLADAEAVCYPLEKRGWGRCLSRGKGKLVVKVFLIDNSSDTIGDDDYTAGNSTSNEHRQKQEDELRRDFTSIAQTPGFAVKHISPSLGGGSVVDGLFSRARRIPSSHDLVETMWYVFVSVVRGRNLPDMCSMGSLDPYVEVKFGKYKAKTKHIQREKNPEWGVVFAFSNDYMQSADALQVVVRSLDSDRDDLVGNVSFDLSRVPTCVRPAASALTPQWYRLVHPIQERGSGELMLSVWKGTQADEAFADAWHSDSATPTHPSPITSQLRSRVHSAPTLWYVRLNIIRAEGLDIGNNIHVTSLHVKANIGSKYLKTRIAEKSNNPSWNEKLTFVAAEPFEDHLILSLQGCGTAQKYQEIARLTVPLISIDKRTGTDDNHEIDHRWFHLEKPEGTDVARRNQMFNGRVLLGLCLEGGYCVLDSSVHNSGDLRPTAGLLCGPAANGFLELGILKAEKLEPTKKRRGRQVVDPYCVIKYGRKWVPEYFLFSCFWL